MATAPCFQGGPFLTGATVVLSSCAIIIQGHIATHRHIHAILHCCLPAGDSLAGRGRPGASVHLTLHATGHHSPAEQRDQDHKSPAGDHAETPQNVASRDGQTILREEAIEGMEYALAFHGRSLVAILL